MKLTIPIRQTDALRHSVPLGVAIVLRAPSLDTMIELQEKKELLALLLPTFLTSKEYDIIARQLGLGGKDRLSLREIAKELKLSLWEVMDYNRTAQESIVEFLPAVWRAYTQVPFEES